MLQKGGKIGSEKAAYQILFFMLMNDERNASVEKIEHELCQFCSCVRLQKMEEAMKVVKHGDAVILIIERGWEKAYLMTQQGVVEWVPIFLRGESTPFAEIDPVSRQVRLCAGQELLDQKKVVFHDV